MPPAERIEIALRLADGQQIAGAGPVVVLGPNGSGKTRQTRTLQADASIEFVNALRNTRVAADLPAMGMDTARANFQAQKQTARNQHWELTAEFDFMLSKLLAEDAMSDKEFMRTYRLDPANAGSPPETPLSRVEKVWGQVFVGRALMWRDWKPMIRSTTQNESPVIEYSGNQMSDGEKAALFVAARVFSADPGVLVVDEPETHFHSLLAVRLWNALEAERTDLRFVYVTHDLTFALSRRDARYIIASPTAGLKIIELDDDLPSDVAGILLGAASLSFYASRIIFCEGEESSLDFRLLSAWFRGDDTVVRPVGGCDDVVRCVRALDASGIAQSLQAVGLVDRDYHNDNYLASFSDDVSPLAVHEIESLFALPAVVTAVCKYMRRTFDQNAYLALLQSSVSEQQRHRTVIRRWQSRVEPQVVGLVSTVSSKAAALETLVDEIPPLFDMANWSFSPKAIFEEEKTRVDEAVAGVDPDAFFKVVPGKQLLPLAARTAGQAEDAYVDLIISAIGAEVPDDLAPLGAELVHALEDKGLPLRIHSSPNIQLLTAAE